MFVGTAEFCPYLYSSFVGAFIAGSYFFAWRRQRLPIFAGEDESTRRRRHKAKARNELGFESASPSPRTITMSTL
jgi:hypothetical protein